MKEKVLTYKDNPKGAEMNIYRMGSAYLQRNNGKYALFAKNLWLYE